MNKKEYDKKYQVEHKQHYKELNSKWYQENKEYKNNYCKQWRKDNPKWKTYMKTYMKIYMKIYRQNNPDKIHKIDLRHFNKRKRNLGFELLNKYFKGSEAHHISQNLVVYIPINIHRSISHCLENRKNMAHINDIAMCFI